MYVGYNSRDCKDFLYKWIRLFTCRNFYRKVRWEEDEYIYYHYDNDTCLGNILCCLESIWHCLKNIMSSLICDCKFNFCYNKDNAESETDINPKIPV